MMDNTSLGLVKVRLTLRLSQQVDTNHWKASIHGEDRILTTRDVEYYCVDMNTAILSFKKSEVSWVSISAEYSN